LYPCHRCHHQTSFISGTLFEYTKLPLTTWFLGNIHPDAAEEWASVLELKRLLGISYNAARRLKHKRIQAMQERDDSQPLSGNVQMDNAYLGGERPGGKRGRGAAGKTPFVAAVQTNGDGHPIAMRLSKLQGAFARLSSLPGRRNICGPLPTSSPMA